MGHNFLTPVFMLPEVSSGGGGSITTTSGGGTETTNAIDAVTMDWDPIAGASAGDLGLVIRVGRGLAAAPTITTPAGWSLLFANAGSAYMLAAYKVLSAGDLAGVQLTLSASARGYHEMPYLVKNATGLSVGISTSATGTVPSISPSTAAAAFCAIVTDDLFAGYASLTNGYSADLAGLVTPNNGSYAILGNKVVSAGATGTVAADVPSGGAFENAFHVAFA